MQRKKLFTYWEGPKPEFVTMCEEIIAYRVTTISTMVQKCIAPRDTTKRLLGITTF